MAERTIVVSPDGQIRFVDLPESRHLAGLGSATTRRASNVEPTGWLIRIGFRIIRACVADASPLARWTRGWAVLWRANLRRSGGPIIGPFYARGEAIQAEIDWLESNGVPA